MPLHPHSIQRCSPTNGHVAYGGADRAHEPNDRRCCFPPGGGPGHRVVGAGGGDAVRARRRPRAGGATPRAPGRRAVCQRSRPGIDGSGTLSLRTCRVCRGPRQPGRGPPQRAAGGVAEPCPTCSSDARSAAGSPTGSRPPCRRGRWAWRRPDARSINDGLECTSRRTSIHALITGGDQTSWPRRPIAELAAAHPRSTDTAAGQVVVSKAFGSASPGRRASLGGTRYPVGGPRQRWRGCEVEAGNVVVRRIVWPNTARTMSKNCTVLVLVAFAVRPGHRRRPRRHRPHPERGRRRHRGAGPRPAKESTWRSCSGLLPRRPFSVPSSLSFGRTRYGPRSP